MIENLYQFREMLKEKGVYLSIVGPFSQSLIEGLTLMIRQKLQSEAVKAPIVKNIFAVVIEQAQNIIRYSAESIPVNEHHGQQEHYSVGAIAIGYDDEYYFVISGNMIEKAKAQKLRKRLLPLQTLTKEELKQLYKEQRRKGPDEDSKGAGLGLIDMARKASKPLEFNFQEIDETRIFFSIKIMIHKL
jgi:hypothetical protein